VTTLDYRDDRIGLARLIAQREGPIILERGRALPLGATPDADGANFSLFSEHATSVELLLFRKHDDPLPFQIFRLDPDDNRTFHFWHAYLRGLVPGVHYAYRVDGPRDLAGGHRFDPEKLLIDPYARGVNLDLWHRAAACAPGDNLATSMRCVVVDDSDYDWEGDRPLNRPMSETIIYEMHVRGFTRSPSSGCRHPGTFEGMVEKIPYLQALGVTAVELMPIFQFDETELLRYNPLDGQPLRNYWGYDPVAFFAPEGSYCVSSSEGTHLREFRDMVKALHRAGIEVILDVVFNHTNERGQDGPTFCFRGLDNSNYYYLDPDDRRRYLDYSGCGNTLKCNHPIMDKLILDCLEFWVREMHVDGFRFDEGSILSRGEDGAPMKYPPVLWHIELTDALAETKIIAEAWDAAGLYQVGYFPGARWAEWNGRYRDDLRRFVRGDPGLVGAVASRIAGSADLYQTTGHLPVNSINFVTCHDGFTLNDLVSYNQKHNLANGEENRDGTDCNHSWNCGVEGEPDDPEVERLRLRQIKNLAAILLLSQGVPMILSGDEVRRTQRGNNNGYCQDNEVGWFDWTQVEENADLLRFFQGMIDFRKRHPALRRGRFFTGRAAEGDLPDIAWHGCRLFDPGWSDPNARALAFTMDGVEGSADLHVMMNMDGRELEFEVPILPNRVWLKALDTAAPPPLDLCATGDESERVEGHCLVLPHSVVALVSY